MGSAPVGNWVVRLFVLCAVVFNRAHVAQAAEVNSLEFEPFTPYDYGSIASGFISDLGEDGVQKAIRASVKSEPTFCEISRLIAEGSPPEVPLAFYESDKNRLIEGGMVIHCHDANDQAAVNKALHKHHERGAWKYGWNIFSRYGPMVMLSDVSNAMMIAGGPHGLIWPWDQPKIESSSVAPPVKEGNPPFAKGLNGFEQSQSNRSPVMLIGHGFSPEEGEPPDRARMFEYYRGKNYAIVELPLGPGKPTEDANATIIVPASPSVLKRIAQYQERHGERVVVHLPQPHVSAGSEAARVYGKAGGAAKELLDVGDTIEDLGRIGVEKVLVHNSPEQPSCDLLIKVVRGIVSGGSKAHVRLAGEDKRNPDPSTTQFEVHNGTFGFCGPDEEAAGQLRELRELFGHDGVDLSTYSLSGGREWERLVDERLSSGEVAIVDVHAKQALLEVTQNRNGSLTVEFPWDEEPMLVQSIDESGIGLGAFDKMQKKAPSMFVTKDKLWRSLRGEVALDGHLARGYVVGRFKGVSIFVPPLPGVIEYLQDLQKSNSEQFRVQIPTDEAVGKFHQKYQKNWQNRSAVRAADPLPKPASTSLVFPMFAVSALGVASVLVVKWLRKPDPRAQRQQQIARGINRLRGDLPRPAIEPAPTRLRKNNRVDDKRSQDNDDKSTSFSSQANGAKNNQSEERPTHVIFDNWGDPTKLRRDLSFLLSQDKRARVQNACLDVRWNGKSAAQCALDDGRPDVAAAIVLAILDSIVRSDVAERALKVLNVDLSSVVSALVANDDKDRVRVESASYWRSEVEKYKHFLSFGDCSAPYADGKAAMQGPLLRQQVKPWQQSAEPLVVADRRDEKAALRSSPETLKWVRDLLRKDSKLGTEVDGEVFFPNPVSKPHLHGSRGHFTLKKKNDSHIPLTGLRQIAAARAAIGEDCSYARVLNIVLDAIQNPDLDVNVAWERLTLPPE